MPGSGAEGAGEASTWPSKGPLRSVLRSPLGGGVRTPLPQPYPEPTLHRHVSLAVCSRGISVGFRKEAWQATRLTNQTPRAWGGGLHTTITLKSFPERRGNGQSVNVNGTPRSRDQVAAAVKPRLLADGAVSSPRLGWGLSCPHCLPAVP